MTGTRWRLLGLALVASMVHVGTAVGGDKSGIPDKLVPPEISKEAREKAGVIDKVAAAYALVDQGRKLKSPEMLTAAAELLAVLEPVAWDGAVNKPAKKPARFDTVDDLLAEALAYGGGKGYVKEMVAAVTKRIKSKDRDLLHPISDAGALDAGEKATYKRKALANSVTRIHVRTDGQGDCDVYVYQDGKLLAFDRAPDGNASVSFMTAKAGEVSIVVHNSGGKSLRYIINSN